MLEMDRQAFLRLMVTKCVIMMGPVAYDALCVGRQARVLKAHLTK